MLVTMLIAACAPRIMEAHWTAACLPARGCAAAYPVSAADMPQSAARAWRRPTRGAACVLRGGGADAEAGDEGVPGGEGEAAGAAHDDTGAALPPSPADPPTAQSEFSPPAPAPTGRGRRTSSRGRGGGRSGSRGRGRSASHGVPRGASDAADAAGAAEDAGDHGEGANEEPPAPPSQEPSREASPWAHAPRGNKREPSLRSRPAEHDADRSSFYDVGRRGREGSLSAGHQFDGANEAPPGQRQPDSQGRGGWERDGGGGGSVSRGRDARTETAHDREAQRPTAGGGGGDDWTYRDDDWTYRDEGAEYANGYRGSEGYSTDGYRGQRGREFAGPSHGAQGARGRRAAASSSFPRDRNYDRPRDDFSRGPRGGGEREYGDAGASRYGDGGASRYGGVSRGPPIDDDRYARDRDPELDGYRPDGYRPDDTYPASREPDFYTDSRYGRGPEYPNAYSSSQLGPPRAAPAGGADRWADADEVLVLSVYIARVRLAESEWCVLCVCVCVCVCACVCVSVCVCARAVQYYDTPAGRAHSLPRGDPRYPDPR
jgi:hypothetical protein